MSDVPCLHDEANLRYMVDTETYKLMHSNEEEQTLHSDLSEATLQASDPPEGSFALMLPPTIRGFDFHNKKWSKLFH
jgi:hypothetical protein